MWTSTGRCTTWTAWKHWGGCWRERPPCRLNPEKLDIIPAGDHPIPFSRRKSRGWLQPRPFALSRCRHLCRRFAVEHPGDEWEGGQRPYSKQGPTDCPPRLAVDPLAQQQSDSRAQGRAGSSDHPQLGQSDGSRDHGYLLYYKLRAGALLLHSEKSNPHAWCASGSMAPRACRAILGA